MNENPIAARIDSLLAERGESRRKMCKAADIDYDRLNTLWRRPGAKPNTQDLRALANHLETSQDWILYGGEKPTLLAALREQVVLELDQLSEGELRGLLVGIQARRASGRAGTD